MRRSRITQEETEGDTAAFIFLPGVLDEIYTLPGTDSPNWPASAKLTKRYVVPYN